jgi:ribose transport system substrate-binding protein
MRSLHLGAAAVAVALVVAGCGSSGADNASTSGRSGGAGAVAGGPSLSDLQAGTYSAPPTTSPPGAKGKNVWWISCGQQVDSCAKASAAAEDAARTLGLDFHLGDMNLNIGGGESTAVRTAIAAHADAIAIYGGGGCEGAQAALQEAVAAHILVLGVETPDCSAGGGPKIFNVYEKYSDKYPDDSAYWQGFGKTNADYIIAKSGGTAKIIQNGGHTNAQDTFINEGFTNEIKQNCPQCQIVAQVGYTNSELSPEGPWIQAFRTALVQHPDATAAFFPWDLMMTSLGGAQAVIETGRNLMVVGGQAAPDGLDFVRQGKITAQPTAMSRVWSGYAAIDTLNRALQGQTAPAAEGMGYQLVDKTTAPQSGDYVPPVDVKAGYEKAWNNGAGTQ